MNLLSTLIMESKHIYYTKYFEIHWNYTKITWKGIKTTISIKNIATTMPHSVEFDSRTITESTAMSRIVNN